MNQSDLAAFKTPEEYATFVDNIDARLRELDEAHPGQPLPESERAEFSDLQELRKTALLTKDELEFRAKVVGSLNDADHALPAAPKAVQVMKTRHVPENVFAIEQYRSMATSEETYSQALRDGAMFAAERATYEHPRADQDKAKGQVARLLDTIDTPDKQLARRILATGSPEYRRAFAKYLAGAPRTGAERLAEERVAALTVQTDATGGYAVPFSFDPTLVHVGAWTTINPYRSTCTVKQIVGTDTFHGATAAAVTIARAAEAAATTEGGGAIGQIELIASRVQAAVTASIELFQDRPDLASEIASLISEAKDTEEENIFTVGTGAVLGAGVQPTGVLPAHGTATAYTHIATAASNTLAIGDLYSTEAALPVRHRANAIWVMNRANIRAIQALETTGGQLFGGQYYQAVGYPQNSRVGNTGLSLLNYPLYEAPSAPSTAADNDGILTLFNPSTFYIVDRVGMSVEVIPHFFDAGTGFPTGQRMVFAMWRNTAKPANVDGGRILYYLP